jgi:hypothetical protein
MRTIIKIILILLGFILVSIPFSILKSLNGLTSGVSGMFGFLLIIGFFAGARAIWKYNPSKKYDTKDKHELDKS